MTLLNFTRTIVFDANRLVTELSDLTCIFKMHYLPLPMIFEWKSLILLCRCAIVVWRTYFSCSCSSGQRCINCRHSIDWKQDWNNGNTIVSIDIPGVFDRVAQRACFMILTTDIYRKARFAENYIETFHYIHNRIWQQKQRELRISYLTNEKFYMYLCLILEFWSVYFFMPIL